MCFRTRHRALGKRDEAACKEGKRPAPGTGSGRVHAVGRSADEEDGEGAEHNGAEHAKPNRRIFGGLELPPAALQTLGPVSILVFVPVYDRVLVPVLRRATGNPSGLTPLQRIGTGMAVSLVAVSVAALVEGRRLETAREHGLVDDTGAAVPMSWVWLVPQYAMVGLADVFAVVGMQEFFYDQMPGELRSLGLALCLSVLGIGGFISSALISLIDGVTSNNGGDSWFADNLNRAHLDYFYWLLAGVSAAELALYFCLASSYVYNNHKSLK